MPGTLPSGTVTLLFTDVEGSTRLLHELGPQGYGDALAEHRRALRAAFARHGGVEVDTQGDAFFFAFASAAGAVQAAREAQEALSPGLIRVRMGIHTGTPHRGDEGYVGEDVHKAARIASAAHGGQVVLSGDTRALLGDGVPLTDLGEHRLKDFDGAVPIFQVGRERFPPLKTISNTNLPRPASSFVGREKEVGEVTALLRGGTRLVTLTGPGGSGKTRLAIEAASELVPEFKAGVFWVGLAPIRDPALVTEEIARTLGANDGLVEHVGEREMLLLLDNLEQVIPAASDISSLLEACANLRLLVTSRELLRLRGEVEYSVPPLATPEAVDLFCTRARLEPDDAIEELCRRLDNLPLAIELAAARARVLSPGQILERLSKRLDLLKGGRDADPRQQTLRATIEWSHDLLAPEEKALFARLSVFRGGCTVEAAEEVAEADLDTLQSLVDKSLLRRTADRFWMLETIREFAIERLEASGEAEELRRRHAEYFLTLGETAEPHLRLDSQEWVDRMEHEHDNLRAALDRLEARNETELVLRLAGSVFRFWYLRSHLQEGQRRLEAALAADDRATSARAKALAGASVMALNLRQIPLAKQRAEEALSSYREVRDPWGIAYATMMVGNALGEGGDVAGGQPVIQESVRMFRELGDDHYLLIAMVNLAWMTGELGDLAGERALQEEILTRARRTGNERMQAAALAQLSFFVRDEGRYEDARLMLREAIRINHARGSVQDVAIDLGRLASTLARTGSHRAAARTLSSGLALAEGLGAADPWWAARRNQETLEMIRGALDDAAFTEEWEAGRKLSFDEAVAFALRLSD